MKTNKRSWFLKYYRHFDRFCICFDVSVDWYKYLMRLEFIFWSLIIVKDRAKHRQKMLEKALRNIKESTVQNNEKCFWGHKKEDDCK